MLRPLLLFLTLASLLCGCPGPTPPPADASNPDTVSPEDSGPWVCPEGWVATARGGCGPASVLCAPDGGAASGACEGFDPTRGTVRADPDGGSYTAPWVDSTGALRGGWVYPGEAGGPPRADWWPDAGAGAPPADFAPDAGATQCPAGWTLQDQGYCSPTMNTSCPAGTGALPGGDCTATGESSCGADPWPTPGPELVGHTLVYVRADAAAGGTGSMTAPLSSLSAGLALAGEGGVVLVGAGTLHEGAVVVVTGARTVLGVCASRAILAGPAAGAALLVGAGASLTVRGLALEGAGFDVRDGGSLTAQGVRVTGGLLAVNASGAGTRVAGSELFLTRTTIDSKGQFGVALAGGDGAQLALTRTAITQTQGTAASMVGASTLALTDSAVTDVGSAQYASGLESSYDSHAILTRVLVERASAKGLWSQSGVFEVHDTLVRDTRVRSGEAAGVGVSLESAQLTGAGLWVVQARGIGLQIYGSSAQLAGCAVTGTFAGRAGASSAVQASNGATGRLANCVLSQNNTTAVYLAGTTAHPTALTLADSVLRDVTSSGTASTRFLANATDHSTLTLAGVRGSGNAFGLVAAGASASLLVSDSVVALSGAGDPTLPGLQAQGGGQLTATRVRLSGSVGVGAGARDPGSRLTVQDSVQTGLVPDTVVGSAAAFGAYLGGTLLVQGASVEHCAGVGFMAGIAGDVTVTDSAVRQPQRAPQTMAFAYSTSGGTLRLRRVAGETLTSGLAAVAAANFTPDMDPGGDGLARIDAEDVVLHGLAPPSEVTGDTQYGGLTAETGSQVALRRCLFDAPLYAGIFALHQGTRVQAEAVCVQNVQRELVVDGEHWVLGSGLMVTEGARFEGRGLVIDGAATYGISLSSRGQLWLRDTLVRNVVSEGPAQMLVLGLGLASDSDDATTDAAGLAIERVGEGGVLLVPGASSSLSDVLVRGVRASDRGYGYGVMAAAQGTLTLSRVAVLDVRGVGVSAQQVPAEEKLPGDHVTLRATDLFVQGVGASTVRPVEDQSSERPVAYGLFVSPRASLNAQRATVLDGGYGFFASVGELSLRDAVLSGQLDAAGAFSGTTPVLEGLVRAGNTNDNVVQDTSLPEVVMLPPPTEVCPMGVCF